MCVHHFHVAVLDSLCCYAPYINKSVSGQRMKSHCGGNSLHDLLIKYYIAWNHGKSPPRVLSTRNLGRAELQLQSSALRGPKVHEWPPLQYCLLSMFFIPFLMSYNLLCFGLLAQGPLHQPDPTSQQSRCSCATWWDGIMKRARPWVKPTPWLKPGAEAG